MKKRVLYISQEITPYLPETKMSSIGRYLPQGIQEKGKEIRTFMPKFGCINERRNQLHEVIRLSGMNLIIDDNDHPLIIKVASIQPARMQVYFIDNEDYFQRKATLTNDKGQMFDDNDERAIFFCRGVLETVKKLGWAPDLVHCNGWMTSLIPLFLKTSYKDEPLFNNTKVVYSLYNDTFEKSLDKGFSKKVIMDGVESDHVAQVNDPTFDNISKLAIDYADGVIIGDEEVGKPLADYAAENSSSFLTYQSEENYVDAYNEFYEEVLEHEEVLAG